MLRTIRSLFDSVAAKVEVPARDPHALQLATAVLLIEVMRADAEVGDEERTAISAALRERFALSDDELPRLLELAAQTATDAYDFQRFTSQLNKSLDAEEKVRIIEYLWQVALADGHLSAHENHLMRKVAALLYISHGDYVAAKMRAQQSAVAQ